MVTVLTVDTTWTLHKDDFSLDGDKWEGRKFGQAVQNTT